LVFAAHRIVTPAGERSGFVGVSGGRITEISDHPLPATTQITVADDEILLPGLVDTHVHVNEPGRTEWEGFATATRAAAAGGVTTLIDMPLNSIPPTTDLPALATKRATAADQIHVDVGCWAGAVPGNTADLADLHHAGVFGFKAFTLHSGVDEFGHLTRAQLAEAMRHIAALDALLIVHAEDPAAITPASGRRYQDFLASRPPEAETSAIAGLLEQAEETGARLHILHLSSAEAIPLLAGAKRRGVRVTAETCPHYLTFTAEEIPDGATQFKCCPPIREAVNRERLWQGLADGTIDMIVSDHSPCTTALKRLDTGDFGQAWGGIAGLQIGLPAIWTAASERGFPITDVIRWMATNPADLVGLPTKGRIEPGANADLFVFAPDAEFTVTAADLHHRNKLTAYEGRRLTGVVRATWLRGRRLTGEPGGTLLTRGET
jgi:allantoinase